VIAATAVVISLAAMVVSIGAAKANGSVTLLDGSRMGQATYNLLRSENSAEIIRQFTLQYGADVGKDFWATPYDGVTPRQALENAMETECAQSLALFAWGKQYNLVSFDTFGGFFKDWQAENQRRTNASAVYGLQQFTAPEYYDYIVGSLKQQLPDLMGTDAEGLESGIEAKATADWPLTQRQSVVWP
jgi:hypothetical protein